jgi:ribonuclease E
MVPGAEARLEHAPGDTNEIEPGEPESGVEEAEPEGNTFHAETSPSASDEANDKRRRRRRRGRRGRRREGEVNPLAAAPGSAPSADQQHEDIAVFVPPALESEVAEERPVVMPNAPSSPLWSLTDHASTERLSAEHAPAQRFPERRPSLPEVAVQHMQTRNSVFEDANTPNTTAPESFSSQAPEEQPSDTGVDEAQMETQPPSEIVDDTPRELRKGWWQRRFKI